MLDFLHYAPKIIKINTGYIFLMQFYLHTYYNSCLCERLSKLLRSPRT